MPGFSSFRKGASGKGKGGRSFFNAGNDLFAPTASSSAGEVQKKELKGIPAVHENEHFHMDFLRPYPDGEGSCVKDYGKGPARLAHGDVHSHTTAKNTEWKRRLEYATSFTASAVRVLVKIANTIPANLDSILPADDSNSILRALALLRQLLVDSAEGTEFVSACCLLDASNDIGRSPDDLQKAIVIFLKFVATTEKFTTAMQLMIVHGAALFTGGSWGLEAATMPTNMQAWGDGFPAAPEIRAFYTEEMKTWLRDPTDLMLVVDAMKTSYIQRFGGADTKAVTKQSWASLNVSGIKVDVAPDKKVIETKRQAKSWEDLCSAPTQGVRQVKPRLTWANLGKAPPKASIQMDELEIEEDEDDTTAMFTEWAHGDVQLFMTWVEDAISRIGFKDNASQRACAYKIKDYVERLLEVPENIRANYGLGGAVEKLNGLQRVPRNIRTFLDRMTTMAEAANTFHDQQRGAGTGVGSDDGVKALEALMGSK